MYKNVFVLPPVYGCMVSFGFAGHIGDMLGVHGPVHVQLVKKNMSPNQFLLKTRIVRSYHVIRIKTDICTVSKVARGSHKGDWRAACGPRAGRCPGLVWIHIFE